jgi:choline dehydrogenase-like flavoprotein
MTDTARLRELAGKALGRSGNVWKATSTRIDGTLNLVESRDGYVASCDFELGQDEDHAAYIAAANPTAILSLLDELDASKARIVEVKPLEWQFYPDAFPPAWDAPTPFGRYSIEEGWSPNTEDPAWHSDSEPIWTLTFSGQSERVFNSLEAAQASAQAGYAARILSTLAPPPHGDAK